MKINEYINLHPNKADARRALAESIGVSEITVRSWANGNRHPDRKIWPKIVKATKGKVSLIDLANG